jgi:hypothetical protein
MCWWWITAAALDSGPFGEIMALACQMRGIAGLVIDGAVRDSAQIAALGFAVFARGLNIRGTTKQDRGQIGGPVTLGGATIAAATWFWPTLTPLSCWRRVTWPRPWPPPGRARTARRR